MSKLVFDIETTGFPKKHEFMYYHPSDIDKYENARIIEISYAILENDKTITVKQYLIKTDKPILNSSVHGITDDMCKNGLNFNDFVNLWIIDLQKVDTLIAHNIQFDYSVILSELFRLNRTDVIDMLRKKKLYCTMINSMKYLKSPKFPKLIDVYNHITGEQATQTHRAQDDVNMCVKIYHSIAKTNNEFITLRYYK